jgi:Fe-S cluster assembly protein SufD
MEMLSYGYLSEVIYKVSDESIQKWLSAHLDEVFVKFHVENVNG